MTRAEAKQILADWLAWVREKEKCGYIDSCCEKDIEAFRMAIEELDDDYKDEIVSCRDCKHHLLVSDDICVYPKCELQSGIWWDSDFCSRGERKESDTE